MIKRIFAIVAVVGFLTVTSFADAPVIAVQPSDCFLPESALNEGGTVSFSVVATGDNLSYQWQSFNLNGDGSWANVSNSTGRTANLSISATSAIVNQFINNEVKFKCIVTSSDGQSVETQSVATSIVGVFIFGSLNQMISYIESTGESIISTVGETSSTIVNVPFLALALGFFFIGGVCSFVGRCLRRS